MRHEINVTEALDESSVAVREEWKCHKQGFHCFLWSILDRRNKVGNFVKNEYIKKGEKKKKKVIYLP